MNSFCRSFLIGLAFCGTFLSATGEMIDLKSLTEAVLKAHVDGKPGAPADGSRFRTGEDGLTLDCRFMTRGHDAVWVEFPCELEECEEIAIERTLSDGVQRLFVVLTDAKGESHLFEFGRGGPERRMVRAKVAGANKYPGERFAWRWGGDDNQKIDWPVKKIALGVNDTPDEFIGPVTVVFHALSYR